MNTGHQPTKSWDNPVPPPNGPAYKPQKNSQPVMFTDTGYVAPCPFTDKCINYRVHYIGWDGKEHDDGGCTGNCYWCGRFCK